MILIRSLSMSDDAKKTLCVAINNYGDGQHPFADSFTIDSFTVEYAYKCIQRAKNSLTKYNPPGTDELLALTPKASH